MFISQKCHHGLDFLLPEETEVLATDLGKVIQAGENGDWGISVTVKHPWGESLYAHLKETKVVVDQEINKGEAVGLSGQSGAAFGPHLHFGIKPASPDLTNGYLGFIDPLPYLPPQSPPQPLIKEVKVVDEAEVERRVNERLVQKIEELRQKANQKRAAKKQIILEKILNLPQQTLTNQKVRDKFHLSRQATTLYLSFLTNQGKLRRQNQGRYTFYEKA
ncbi:M23 family metallopeptidase [Candidatus Gottesmanbacteria bacterium]|nr:M23 family metallopeptidase [Candidatus Gottesmanbacteria bacterium]